MLYFRNRGEAALGDVDQFGALALDLNLDQDRDWMADLGRVDQRHIGADDAGLLHAPDAPLHGRRRQVHHFADRALRYGVVLLQQDEDRAVEGVEIGHGWHLAASG